MVNNKQSVVADGK